MLDNSIYWPIIVILPIISLTLVILGAKTLFRKLCFYFGTQTAKTSGIIVDITESRTDSLWDISDQPFQRYYYDMFWVPTVAYRDGDVVYKITGEARRSLKRSIAIGKEVPILYSKQNPQDAVIGSFYEMWAYPVLRLAIGLALLLPAYGAIRIMLAHLHF